MLYTIIQPKGFLGSGEEDFKVFLQYMGLAAILSSGKEPLEHFDRGFHE